ILSRIPEDAWSAPINPYDEPTPHTNYVSLKLFYRSNDGLLFFTQEIKEMFPTLCALAEQPDEFAFHEPREAQTKLTHGKYLSLTKEYYPTPDELTLVNDAIENRSGISLLLLLDHCNLLSLLCFTHMSMKNAN